MTRSTTELLLLLGVAGLLVFYLLGRWDRAISAEERAWARAADAALVAGKRWRARQDSLVRLSHASLERAQTAAGTAARHDRQALALRASLAKEPWDSTRTLRSLVVTMDSASQAWHRAYLGEARALAVERLRADLAEERVRLLDSLLATSPARQPCRIAWIVSCPSRKTAFLAGLVVGAATVLLSRQ